MSEIKRPTLIPLASQKVEDKKGKEAGKTVRISLVLPESNEDTCPEYNYKEELAAAKRKEKIKHHVKPTTNGLDPFNEDDDDVRRIAQEMEAKYGCSGPKKKRKGRRDDYADIGMGYDESDSFIDNTDGYDEMIPQNVTTLLGGFYINCGALEFKTDEEASSEITSSSSDEDTPDKNASRKRIREDISSDTEGETETDKNIVHLTKAPKLDVDGIPKLMKKKYLSPDKMKQLKKKRSEEKKKAPTIKELLKEKRDDDVNVLPMENNSLDHIEIKEEPADSMKENKKPMSIANISDIIEQVVRGMDEEIKKTDKPIVVNSSSEKSGAVVSSDADNSREADDQRKPETEIVKLPENLPNDIVEIIDKMKDYASKNTEGKVKFFSGPVSVILLRLERKCKCLGKQSRMKIYEHLAPFVKCRKETLIRRAKNLVLEDEHKRLKGLLDKLRAQIETAMSPLLESYERESLRITQKKFSKESLSNEENKQLRMPKRKFTWTEEIKKLLKEVVLLRKRCFLLEGKNKDNLEDLLNMYLKTDIRILWPEGWMSMTALQRICVTTVPELKKSSNSSSLEVKKPANTIIPAELKKSYNTTSLEVKKPVCPSTKTSTIHPSVDPPQRELQKLSSNSNLSITPVTSNVSKPVNSNVNIDRTLIKSDITINKIDSKDNVSKTNKSLPDVIKTSNAISIMQTATSIKTTCDRMERLDFIKPNIESEVIVLEDAVSKPVIASDNSGVQSKHDISKVRSENVQIKHDISKLIGENVQTKHDHKVRSENAHVKHDGIKIRSDSIQVKHDVNKMKNENIYVKHDVNKVRSEGAKHDINKLRSENIQVKHDINTIRSDSNHCQIIDLTEQLTQEIKKPIAPKLKSKYYEGDKGVKCKPTSELIHPKQPDKEELTGSSALNHLIAESLSDVNNLPQNLTKAATTSHSKISETNAKNYNLSSAYTTATTSLDYPKIKPSNEGDDIQKVMEDLKVLQKLSSPVKVSESPTSSPVSVIAFNKNYSPKGVTSHSTPISQPPTSLPYRNEYTKADFSSGFQEAFQRQLLNDFALMQNSVNHTTPTSSKSHYNSADKYPHTSAAFLSEKYYQPSNNNYTQPNPSKIKTLPPQQSGSYNILDDMLANFLTEYGYPKTANHIPKPQQK